MRRLFDDPKPLIARVYAFVATRIGPGAEAEDVTSAVFERALRYSDSFDPARGTPLGWLLGIARRELADRPRQTVHLSEAREPAADDPAEGTADRLTIWAAVARLDERDQALIALRYAGDLSARQIADVLELRPNTVEVALHRALRRLEDDLRGLERRVLDVRPVPAEYVRTVATLTNLKLKSRVSVEEEGVTAVTKSN